MVDPITASGRPRIARPGEDIAPATGGAAQVASGKAAATKSSADVVSLSQTAQSLPPELSESGPPMDLEIVKRIKEAIAEGKYPIDLEAITDSLFQDFLELRG
ncbi:MAG: flagellar biosynthesis anti-sigma factor FlgM [Pseudomonadota bacterium]|jgi:negative regulator of flagellin synthesis FlgM